MLDTAAPLGLICSLAVGKLEGSRGACGGMGNAGNIGNVHGGREATVDKNVTGVSCSSVGKR